VVPGVNRADGLDTFHLEVEISSPAARVALRSLGPCVVPVGDGLVDLGLRDDGGGEDRVSGDLVYTSVALRFDPSCQLPAFFADDPSSPAGLAILRLGEVEVEAPDGTVAGFLSGPEVGILAPDVPATPAIAVAPDVVVAPHFVNVRSEARETQRFLRFPSDDLTHLTTRLYALWPDAFDFLVFFSTDHLELEPASTPRNFVSGSHRSVQVDYTGTGLPPFDGAAVYGSAGRLLGLNVLDAYDRGLLSKVVTHEILHQWVAYVTAQLGITASDGLHYNPRSSVGSLVGGFRWLEAGDGTFVLDCTEGASGASRAAPLDRYMMGLAAAEEVPAVRAYDDAGPSPVLRCGQVIADVVRTVTVADIQAVHGPREPGPSEAERDFALGFVAESHGRLLTPTELTFYDILAAHYTARVPPDAPDPYHGSAQWASIARFFGEDVRWTSDVLVCGNGRLEGDEECDDGNRLGGDGCSAACALEQGGFPLPVETIVLGRTNAHSQKRVRVAALTSALVDASRIVPASVRLGAAAPLRSALRDADGDGDRDRILVFAAAAIGVGCGEETAPLTGQTLDGQNVEGTVRLPQAGCP
jgi:cysteine-rich repeat protein